MTRSNLLLPEAPLDRIRYGATVAAIASMLLQLPQIVDPHEPDIWDAFSGIAILAFCVMFVSTYMRRRPSRFDLWLEAPLLVVAASGLEDPLGTVGLVLVVLAVQSLYGSPAGWAARIVVGFLSLPLAVALTPVATGRQLHWQNSAVLSVFPQLILVCVVMRAVYAAMLSRDRSAARDAVLARFGNLMLSTTRIDQVYEYGIRAAYELVALSPGVVALFARIHAGQLQVFAVAGMPKTIIGTSIPHAALHEPAQHLRSIMPGIQHWTIDDIGNDRYRFLGSRRPVGADIVDSFRTMAHQVLLAEGSRRSADALQHQAHHDPLTQLPNRSLFFHRLTEAVELQPPGTVALLNIDLDDFKQVNDTYGHAAGDELLIEIALRLVNSCGLGSSPARFGGDEFAILLTGLPHADAAQAAAAEICRRLMVPVELAAGTVSVGASIGVALSRHDLTAGDLTRCADIAMYSAKAQGKNRVEVFSVAEHGDVARHRTLEQHVGYAVDRGEVILQFQPSVSLTNFSCLGIEATASWEHPTLGVLSQHELLTLAQRTRALTETGTHVIRTACSQFAALRAGPGIRLEINITAHQLLEPTFSEIMRLAAIDAGLKLSRITLVIPETEQIRDPKALAQLHHLADAGVMLSIDKFGTGTVPLTAMESFPLYQARSDRSLLEGSGNKLAMVISVAQLLGANTVVTGVTTPKHLATARRSNANAIQGDLLAAPMRAAEMAAWLLNSNALQDTATPGIANFSE